MKMPQRIRGYCPFCNKHRELEVERVKNRFYGKYRGSVTDVA